MSTKSVGYGSRALVLGCLAVFGAAMLGALLLAFRGPSESSEGEVDTTGIQKAVAQRCGISVDQMYGEQAGNAGFYWSWTDQYGVVRSAGRSLEDGQIYCGR